MRAHLLLLPLLGAGLLALTACGGDDHHDPMGSSGPPVATNYYSNTFDTQSTAPDWLIYQRGGTGSITAFVDTVKFLSPPNSLAAQVNGSVFSDSLVYRPITFIASRAVWMEFDWLLSAVNGETEVVINQNSHNSASIGYNASGIYLTNNGVRTTVSTPDPSQWHHIRMTEEPTNGLSSYWVDNLPIGNNYHTVITPIGAPTVDYVAMKLATNPGGLVQMDNVQVYHY